MKDLLRKSVRVKLGIPTSRGRRLPALIAAQNEVLDLCIGSLYKLSKSPDLC